MKTAMKIGFIGAGHMGAPMAQRLKHAGFDVLVWARREERARALQAQGLATGALADVLAQPVVISCLRDGAAVEAIFSDEATLDQLRASLVIEHATIDPALSRSLSERFAERGIAAIDAPVSGGPEGAAAGTLSTMVGGSEEAFARARPYLQACCSTIVHVGPAGAGGALKLVNQHLVAVHSVAAAEAAALIQAANIDPHAATEALMHGWAASRRLELQLVDSVEGHYGADGADTAPFLEILRLLGGAFEGAGIDSELLPGVSRSWERAVAAHPRARLASLRAAYANDPQAATVDAPPTTPSKKAH